MSIPPPPPPVVLRKEDSNLNLFFRWTFITSGVLVSFALAGIPLLFGGICAAVAPTRGRRWDTGLLFGIWFGVFYLAYLAFQERTPRP